MNTGFFSTADTFSLKDIVVGGRDGSDVISGVEVGASRGWSGGNRDSISNLQLRPVIRLRIYYY